MIIMKLAGKTTHFKMHVLFILAVERKLTEPLSESRTSRTKEYPLKEKDNLLMKNYQVRALQVIFDQR